jgi:hypothetical protein
MMLAAIAKINIELGRHGEALEQAERAFALVEDTKRTGFSPASSTRSPPPADDWHSWTGLSRPASRHSPWPARPSSDEPRRTASSASPSPTGKRAATTKPAPTPNRHCPGPHHSFRVVEGQALTALCRNWRSPSKHTPQPSDLGRKALAVHRETGHRPGEARTLMALARAHRKTDNAAAELMRRQARAIFTDIGVPETEYEALDR